MIPFYGDPFWIITLPGVALALWAQWRLSSAYSRYSNVGTQLGMSGAETARAILDSNGLRDVEIYETGGQLTDHYDPTKRAVFLSTDIAHGRSIASVGVAAHEVGHALQHQKAYGPLGLRMALVPITGFASQASMFIIMAGVFLHSALGQYLLWAGVSMFALVAFFQLITLPVEYDASSRAKAELNRLGIVRSEEAPHVSRMLHAAALT